MSFDQSCSTYWCDTCGREMEINFSRSGNNGIVLSCRTCGSRVYFIKASKNHPGDDSVPKTSQVTGKPTYRTPLPDKPMESADGVPYSRAYNTELAGEECDHFGEDLGQDLSDPYVDKGGV